MMRRQQERLVGAFIAAMGAILTFSSWHSAIYEGSLSISAGLSGPAFTIIGLALTLFPGYQSEWIARGKDIRKLSGIQLGVLIISIGSGLLNVGVLEFWNFYSSSLINLSQLLLNLAIECLM